MSARLSRIQFLCVSLWAAQRGKHHVYDAKKAFKALYNVSLVFKMKTEPGGVMSLDESQSPCPSPTSEALPPSVTHVSRDELRKFLKCKRVGNYLLGKTIGEGSFAKVKQGFHVLTGEKV